MTSPGLAVVVVAAAVAVFVVARLLPDPGTDAVDGLLRPRVSVLAVLFRTVLMLALATCGGIAVLRPILGRSSSAASGRSTNLPSLELFASPSPWPRPIVAVVTWVAAGVGVVGCVLGAVIGQASVPQCALGVVLFAAVALYIRYGNGRGALGVLAATGLGMVVLWVILLASVRAGAPRVLDIVYGATVTVVLGASIYAAALVGDRPQDSALVGSPVSGLRRLRLLKLADEPGKQKAARSPRGARSARTLDRTPAVTRLASLGVGAGTLCSIAGIAQLGLTGPRTWPDAVAGSYGALAVGQAVLPLTATVIWWAVWRADPARAGVAAKVALWSAVAVLVLATGVSSTLAVVARPPAGPEPGTPLLRPVVLGQHRLAVLVSPMRPGVNLVHLSEPKGEERPTMGMPLGQLKPKLESPVTVSLGGSDGAQVTAAPRPGASGQWALIDIPVGTRSLSLTSAGGGVPVSAQVPVDVGTDRGDIATQRVLAGPDGAECASAQLGALLAGAAPASGCPTQELTAPDATSLVEAIAFLAGHKVTTIGVASDDSPRSIAAAALVRAEAGRRGLRVAQSPGPNDTLLVTTGWPGALDALQALVRRVTGDAHGGAVLAPWLASGPILSGASSEMVPLRFDPEQPPARAYVTTLAALFPGAAASPAGYLAWAQQVSPGALAQTRFYGATRADPNAASSTGAIDSNIPDAWYPGGDIVGIK
jgi:hypothetical protein